MKKVLISLILVVLTVCLFVSCEEPPVNTVSFKRNFDELTVVFNRDGSCSYGTGTGTFSFAGQFGLTADVSYPHPFFKNSGCSEKITSFDELVELDTIYELSLGAVEFNKVVN